MAMSSFNGLESDDDIQFPLFNFPLWLVFLCRFRLGIFQPGGEMDYGVTRLWAMSSRLM